MYIETDNAGLIRERLFSVCRPGDAYALGKLFEDLAGAFSGRKDLTPRQYILLFHTFVAQNYPHAPALSRALEVLYFAELASAVVGDAVGGTAWLNALMDEHQLHLETLALYRL